MRIGIDARLINWPGIGRYVASLIENLLPLSSPHDYIIYFASVQDQTIMPSLAQNNRVEKVIFPYPVFSISEQLQWPRRIRQDHLDLFHAPHYVVPLAASVPMVVTIHDLVGFRFPEHMYGTIARFYYQSMTRLAVRKADKSITDSDFTRSEMVNLLHTSPSKIQTVYLGVDQTKFLFHPQNDEKFLRQYNFPGRTMLYLGTKKPWKNLPLIIHVLKELIQAQEDVTLILSGKDARRQQDLSQLIQNLGLQAHIQEVGYIEETAVSAFYRAATLFTFPSYYEGFGLPVLEAMASGVPVIASHSASIPEIVGDAGMLLDPHKVPEWVHHTRALLNDEPQRQHLIQQGIRRSQMFTWHKCATETLAVYESAANGS